MKFFFVSSPCLGLAALFDFDREDMRFVDLVFVQKVALASFEISNESVEISAVGLRPM